MIYEIWLWLGGLKLNYAQILWKKEQLTVDSPGCEAILFWPQKTSPLTAKTYKHCGGGDGEVTWK